MLTFVGRIVHVGLLLSFFVSSGALAQAKAQEIKKQVVFQKPLKFEEIERGFFFEGRGGFWSILNPPAVDQGNSYFSPGLAVQVSMGVDIGERVSLSAFALLSTNSMKSDYTGLSESGTVSGDFNSLSPGAQLKVRIVGFEDSQQVKRTWLYLRAGGAVTFYKPLNLLPVIDALVSFGPGLEYNTSLRHFSIGIEANVNWLVRTSALGFSVLPSIKYAF